MKVTKRKTKLSSENDGRSNVTVINEAFPVSFILCKNDFKSNKKTRPRQSVPNSGFHLVGPGLILVNLV